MENKQQKEEKKVQKEVEKAQKAEEKAKKVEDKTKKGCGESISKSKKSAKKENKNWNPSSPPQQKKSRKICQKKIVSKICWEFFEDENSNQSKSFEDTDNSNNLPNKANVDDRSCRENKPK